MNFFLILPYYVRWHYSRAFIDLKNLLLNFISFIYNFFSITRLFGSLFSPWHRFSDSYGKQESFLETFVFNSVMRVVGAFVRLFFIILGIFALIMISILSVFIFIVWFTLPFIIIYAFLVGIGGLFS
jgi:hypothetical protein